MKDFSITALAEIIGAEIVGQAGRHRRIVTGVTIDSRLVHKGDCFFAIKGRHFDGHNFLPEVFAKGAACAVVSRDVPSPAGVILRVEDTVKVLGAFAAEYRRKLNYKVIAITGSVGKTTTRRMIFEVLRRHFRCHEAPASFNTDIGVPLTLLGAPPDCQIVLAELGTNAPGEITNLSRIAQPDIALITTVAAAHLEAFGTLQAIIEEKVSIADHLSPQGLLIISGDCPELLQYCRSRGLNFVSFGRSPGCDISLRHAAWDGVAAWFIIDGVKVRVPLPGEGNLHNALAAWAVCRQFGASAADFAAAITQVSALPLRMELLKIGPLTILNDCYNANPASMKNALDCFLRLRNTQASGQQAGRLVFVCGDMLELGEHTGRLHAELGRAVASAGVHLLLAVGNFAEITARAAQKAQPAGTAQPTHGRSPACQCFADATLLCENLKKLITPDDIILVKGSRACKLESVVEKLKQLFG
jgi:UDP-N-acetylmuramoyl-tripeptide--D-alanyl-D-alanine ligase